jgi:hypothetical protein
MELIGWYVIVPCSVAALLTGLVQSAGIEWGLFRYYWVTTKFILTLGATGLLLLHISAVRQASDVAATIVAATNFQTLQWRLVFDAGLAMLVLLTNTVLSVYRPWGMTRYGRRQLRPSTVGTRAGTVAANSLPLRERRSSWRVASVCARR